VEWSGLAWAVSVGAVLACAVVAWFEGNWLRRPGLSMGFANHGGMWGDLLLLPIANAAIVPHLRIGVWLPMAMTLAIAASIVVHVHWYRGNESQAARPHAAEHMWPARPHGTWCRDLSWAGWLHVLYVALELTLLAGFLLHPMPLPAVLAVAGIFTIHVPIGLLQPRWFVSGRFASLGEQPLLVPCLTALWLVAALKMGGFDGVL
jgi:hypothetical protein